MVSRRSPRVQTCCGKQNAIESDVKKFEFYVSGSNPENQCHLHVVPCEDADWPCLWKSPHPSDSCCKVDPNGKVWGNPRITHAASDTKTSSYNSSLCKRCRKMTTATPSPLSNQTWLQFYERNVKFSPVNSLDTSMD